MDFGMEVLGKLSGALTIRVGEYADVHAPELGRVFGRVMCRAIERINDVCVVVTEAEAEANQRTIHSAEMIVAVG